MRFQILIVDDEELCRKRLKRLLAEDPDCSVVAEVGGGSAAVQALSDSGADIAFLDVQMPEMDGFQVLEAAGEPKPLTIFTTAYDEYALRAFEVHAFDYLLKPFDLKRFRDALKRAKDQVAKSRTGAPDAQLFALFQSVLQTHRSPDRVAVRSGGRVVFVKLDEIDWVEASDNYVCLHCGKETYVLRETMTDLESRLDRTKFIRVHRSAIVQLDRIKELQPWFRGDYQILLRDGTKLTLKKNYREKLESRLLLGTAAR